MRYVAWFTLWENVLVNVFVTWVDQSKLDYPTVYFRQCDRAEMSS